MDIRSVREKIQHHHAKVNAETPVSAAVMIILLLSPAAEIEILITKRAATLPTYAGHYSFPGGMHDASDSDLLATAKREVSEEINLPETSYDLIGQLDDFQDHSGNLVRPFVASMTKERFNSLHSVSRDEIDSIYFFDIKKLKEIKDDSKLYHLTQRRPSYAFTDGSVFIWGLTATILAHLADIISN